jgi:hypothetical protein
MLSRRNLQTFSIVHNPDDGDSKNLQNVCQFLQDYTAQHPIKTVITQNLMVIYLRISYKQGICAPHG